MVRQPWKSSIIVNGFNYETSQKESISPWETYSEDHIWANYQWFLEQVIPVAEANNVKMALHPDDPPISPVNGIGRIFTSASAMDRALSLSDSPSHGLTFCQGTFTTMNENALTILRKYGKNEKIFFVHIRDVVGTPENFRETFHDNGPTNMFKFMQAYKEIGYTGPLRSDHVPTMAGESNYNIGYEMKGNLFGIGYIKGLMHACGIETN